MADAAVGSVAKWLCEQLAEETEYLCGVQGKIEDLVKELEWMECFLQDANVSRHDDARVRKWIREIRDLAYEAEDIVDSYMFKVLSGRHGKFMKRLKRYVCIIREAKSLHEVGSDIDELKLKISTLTSRLQTYGIKITRGASSSVSRYIQLRRSYGHVIEENIIGLDDDVEKLVHLVQDDKAQSKIVALCGMGGLGKTTLAKKVYHHRDVRQHFDAFAWAYISEQCQKKDVFTEILRGLTTEKASYNDMTEEILMEQLGKVQQEKKCLVILDDIWSNDSWDFIKSAFPVDRNSHGKLLFTTRNESVVRYADGKAFIHKQRFLNEDEAWELLKTKLQYDPPISFGEEQGREMEKVGKELLKHCEGLPLAIIALGGVLATKNTLDEWKAVQNIKSCLSKAKQDGLSYKEVLELSYYDLPFYLKPCFLYLGIFHEDAEISARRLIQMWMAEGFLSYADDGEDDGHIHESLEQIGEAYLTELVSRSMVEVGSFDSSGRIKTCRVHDLMRDLSISNAAEENFLKVLESGHAAGNDGELISQSSSTVFSSFKVMNRRRYRRIAIHDEAGWNKLLFSSCFNVSHVKSLLTGGARYRVSVESVVFKAIKQFKLLRVLDLLKIGLSHLPTEVGDLVHLRYLRIKCSMISYLPPSIENLRYLQTLDVRSDVTFQWMPNVLWRMKHLRNLYLPNQGFSNRYETLIRLKLASKLSFDGLNNLELLLNIEPNLHQLKDAVHFTNLRKLSFCKYIPVEKEQLEILKTFRSLFCGRLKNLSFGLRGKVLTDQSDAFANFSHLYKLKLRIDGRVSSSISSVSLLRPNMFPENLHKLKLFKTEISHDPMPILEVLPNLRKLFLLERSCEVNEIICSRGGFLKLTHLVIRGLPSLEKWDIEGEAMPHLQQLRVGGCRKLMTMPEGLKQMHLQEFYIWEMPKSFYDKVRMLGNRRKSEGEANGRRDDDVVEAATIIVTALHVYQMWPSSSRRTERE